MLERDERESESVEVRQEAKGPGSGTDEVSRGPRLFSALGMGITPREVEIHEVSESEEGAVMSESEEGVEPSPPILTGRRTGGPSRVEGATLSREQPLLRPEITEMRITRFCGLDVVRRVRNRHRDGPT